MHGRSPFAVTNENFNDIISHSGRNGNEFTLSCMPGLLCLAIAQDDELKMRRIRSIIDFLDIDFFEDKPGDWIELKHANMKMFNNLSDIEKSVIIAWLEFIKCLVEEDEFYRNEVESALRYWRKTV